MTDGDSYEHRPPVLMRVMCPVHGEVGSFFWAGASYTLGECERYDPKKSKEAGRLVRCGCPLTPERIDGVP